MTLPCTREDPDLWFSRDPVELAEAQRLCQTCPARDSCMPLGVGEVHGIWGGIPRGDTCRAYVSKRRGRPAPDPDLSDVEPRTCAADDCGTEFRSRSRTARFCSERCRRRIGKRASRAAARAQLVQELGQEVA